MTKSDPLIPLPVRLPASLVAQIRQRAQATGESLSDVLRAHLTLDAAKPTGLPTPRRRSIKRLSAVSGTDPVLMRQLVGIGTNLNQLARACNASNLASEPLDMIQILAALRSIEEQIEQIVR